MMATGELLQKENARPYRLFQFIILCILTFLFTHGAYAQEKEHILRKGFTLGATMGYGSARYILNNKDVSDSSFAFGFHGGYAITRNIVFGLEINSWMIEQYNGNYTDSAHWYDYIFFDPDGDDYYLFHDYHESTKGESIDNVSLFLNVFPFHNSPFYLTGGAGKGFYEKIAGNKKYEDDGRAWFLGCGYEFPVDKNMTMGPQFRYSRGRFSNGNYSIAEVSLAFHWYSH
jgi:hypothetical protein